MFPQLSSSSEYVAAPTLTFPSDHLQQAQVQARAPQGGHSPKRVRDCRRATIKSLPPRVSFLIATKEQRVHLAVSFPKLAYGPPTLFLTTSTAYASLSRDGLFHPSATYRISTPGGFPPTKPEAPRRCLSPFLPFSIRFAPALAQMASETTWLQGFDQDGSPYLPEEGLVLRAARSPHARFQTPAGSSPDTEPPPSRKRRVRPWRREAHSPSQSWSLAYRGCLARYLRPRRYRPVRVFTACLATPKSREGGPTRQIGRAHV